MRKNGFFVIVVFLVFLGGCATAAYANYQEYSVYIVETESFAENLAAHFQEYMEMDYSYYEDYGIDYEEIRLQSLIDFAQNRLLTAEVYGEIIRSGRHTPDAIQALEAAVYSADADVLQAAIDAFFDAVIDPYNRYRPYLQTIAHGEDFPQLRHLRGIWIATVINIDWPSVSARGTTPAHVDLQKAELEARFDEAYNLGFNAIIFQVSPTADAFYRSNIVPWSAWLTGETNFTGELIDSAGNSFDPLEYAIKLAHARNMELHAWLNPYRITHSLISYTRGQGIVLSSTGEIVSSLAQIRQEWGQIPGNVFNTLGQYIRLGEGRYVLDPGVPAAREWIVARVVEILENYDIDAIHFDDYFYPSNWNDDAVFAIYNTPENNVYTGIAFPNTPAGRADFRREATTMLIYEINQAIRETAPWVKFGISPGGVWISGDGSTGQDGGGFNENTGSGSTTTWSNFHSSFADTRHWVLENYIDYLTPQLYWDWAHNTAPYGPIADWWARLVRDYGEGGTMRNSQGEYTTTQIFIGTGLYRMVEVPSAKWQNTPEHQMEGMRTFLRQEHYNLGNPNISGSMIFSHNHIRPYRENGMWDTMQSLRQNAWRYPALIPQMPHLGGIAPASPVEIALADGILSWKNGETAEAAANPFSAVRYFVVYGALGEIDIENPAHIFALVPAGEGEYSLEFPQVYNYKVLAVNRLHDKSE